MGKTIYQLSSLEDIQSNDLLAIFDSGNFDTRKGAVSLLQEYMQDNLSFETVSNVSFVNFTADDATPSVSGYVNFKTANVNPTTITNFDNGTDGQVIRVVITDTNTTIDFTGTNLKGNAGVDWTPAVNDSMTCVCDGTTWYCDISDNSA